MSAVLFGSLTRIADLPSWPFPYKALDREDWASGDYVVAEVLPRSSPMETFELVNGRSTRPLAGDLLVGAFARRFATLEATGSFEDMGPDNRMSLMTGAGCFGALTSLSRFSSAPVTLVYRGHVVRGGRKVVMTDFVPSPPETSFGLPVVLLAGTSMSSGKTLSGRMAIRQLKKLGHRVLGAKLTGAGRWRDTLSFQDAGADHTFDFVDAGLPTTVVPEDEYRAAISGLLRQMASTDATVAVIEAGASPLEPYNGGTLVDMIGDQVAFTIVAASDPYAVVGIEEAWKRPIDLVTGPTANTKAGIALVHELTGLPGMDLLNGDTHVRLRQMLEAAVGARG
ncbi:MAG: hypothetical protein HKN72_11520 [Gemmatimonadetes bacterium]|nr:hypothetical protein [Gemmatimonadota bacterium]NNF13847.1 hypothetical protein [Gemmatimonadota bacterium]